MLSASRKSCICRLPAKRRALRTSIRSALEPPEGEAPKRFFGRKNQEKQDAARKALEGMFKGQKDILASFDTGSGGGGVGSGGRRKGLGGGGGGGGDGRGDKQPFDVRAWAAGLGRRLGAGSKAVVAFLGFAAIFVALPFIPRILGLSVRLTKAVLGLDGQARSAARRKPTKSLEIAGDADLGPSEASVISKYGMPENAPASADL